MSAERLEAERDKCCTHTHTHTRLTASHNVVDVRVSEKTLHEVYLPHFKACVDEGAASIMSAYNQCNGHYCGENKHLLTDVLKDMWGFEGVCCLGTLLIVSLPQCLAR